MGRRLMQSSSDIFLGWTSGRSGRDYYIRQLRNAKIKFEVDRLRLGVQADQSRNRHWSRASQLDVDIPTSGESGLYDASGAGLGVYALYGPARQCRRLGGRDAVLGGSVGRAHANSRRPRVRDRVDTC